MYSLTDMRRPTEECRLTGIGKSLHEACAPQPRIKQSSMFTQAGSAKSLEAWQLTKNPFEAGCQI